MDGKKSTASEPRNSGRRFFDLLSEEIVLIILDFLEQNPSDKKYFSLVCKWFNAIESRHRRFLKPLRAEHLAKILSRYPFTSSLDLSLCPRLTDASLGVVSDLCNETLRSINLSRPRFFTHMGLSNLILNCKNLVEIDLSNGTELKDQSAAAIAEAKNLERLLLVRCKSITDMGLGCIAVGCKKLKLLNLMWCVGVGDLGVGLIAIKCKEIRSLNLSYLQISGQCLSQILELQNLETLVLEGCDCIEDESLLVLRQRCSSLQILDISRCQSVSPMGLSSLTDAAVNMNQLNLSYGSRVDPFLVDSLKNLSLLHSLKLDGCQVTSSGLKAIACNLNVSLRELSLSKCTGVTDRGIYYLVAKHKDMKKLDITCCREITNLSLHHITSHCSSLISLKMESCSLVAAEAFVLIGQNCPFLEELDLTDTEIDDEGLKSISRCSNLSSLKVGICLNVSDKGLIHIGANCSKLKELDLYRCAWITDESIGAVARGCPGLEMVSIAYCQSITDLSYVSLSKCPKLHTLESRGCPLVTSLGLGALSAGCLRLRRLDVKKCRSINDAGMIPLAHFSQNLKQISMSYTGVTNIGLLSLASISSLQNLTIIHVEGLTPEGIAAALLACAGLTKVKLHESFKSSIPQNLLRHLEARGCAFQWRDKILKPELDPKCWKEQTLHGAF